MSGPEHRHLRSALEFAVLMASEGQKRRPPMAFPKALKPFFGAARIPSGALGRIRRAIEDDPEFRTALAAGALPELVDEIGRLWLERPAGWEADLDELVRAADAAKQNDDLRGQLRQSERRREAAESAAARTRVELVARDEKISEQSAEIDELQADVRKLSDEAAELRAELIDTRNEVRHARDRERSASEKLADALRQRDDALAARAAATSVRDEVLAERVDAVASVAEIEAAVEAAQALSNRLRSLLPSTAAAAGEAGADERPVQRTPMALPGGVLSSSGEAARHFAASDAVMLIDGYNVSKQAWPNRTLEQQRDALLDAVENLARRCGTDITVVFDGASIVGAHASRRRLVRVVYSPEGVIADDVIRDEVRRLPTSRAVVVVTNDKEIIRDVRSEGANTLSSNALLAAL